MFTLYYDDNVKIVENLLPILRTYGYDFYFAGMEHQMNYANFPLDEPGNGRTGRNISEDIDSNTVCHKRSEFWIRGGPEKKSHTVITTQGEFVNQITVGASGKTTYPICEWNMEMSHGNFTYGESKYNGFALVHVTSAKIDVKLLGVEYYRGLPPKPASTPDLQKRAKKASKKVKKDTTNQIAFDPNAYTVSLMNLRQSRLNDYGFAPEIIDDEYK